MFPLSAEKLPFLEIADKWSREITPHASLKELLELLESAWWRGEIKGNSALDRLQFLQKMFESRRGPHMQSVVFVSPKDAGQPTEIYLPDGGVVVRPEIFVPDEADDWTETSCTDAFETLAGLPSIEYFPYYSISIHFIDLTPLEFFGWIRTRGFAVPTFWKISGPLSSGGAAPQRGSKDERKQATFKGDVDAAYKQRIETYRGKKPPSRIDDEKWAKEQFSLSVTKARDLRRNLAPPDWREPGRRKCKD